MSDREKIERAMDAAERPASASIDTASRFDPRTLRAALGRFATGVTVVTACEANDPHAPVGITANSFASVSLDPALVLWSAARSSLRHRHFAQAHAFTIHVLADHQTDLANRFTGRGAGFNDLDFTLNSHGVPIFEGVLARFECITEATHEGGDHTIIIGRIEAVSTNDSGEPLVFARGQFGKFFPT